MQLYNFICFKFYLIKLTYLRSWDLPEKLSIVQPFRKFPAILRNPKVHCRVHKGPPLVPILSQLPYYKQDAKIKTSLNRNIASITWIQSAVNLRINTCILISCTSKISASQKCFQLTRDTVLCHGAVVHCKCVQTQYTISVRDLIFSLRLRFTLSSSRLMLLLLLGPCTV
jgi:hypothetical protein